MLRIIYNNLSRHISHGVRWRIPDGDAKHHHGALGQQLQHVGQGQVGNVHVVVVELVQVHDAAGGRDQVLVGQDNSLKKKFTHFYEPNKKLHGKRYPFRHPWLSQWTSFSYLNGLQDFFYQPTSYSHPNVTQPNLN